MDMVDNIAARQGIASTVDRVRLLQKLAYE